MSLDGIHPAAWLFSVHNAPYRVLSLTVTPIEHIVPVRILTLQERAEPIHTSRDENHLSGEIRDISFWVVTWHLEHVN